MFLNNAQIYHVIKTAVTNYDFGVNNSYLKWLRVETGIGKRMIYDSSPEKKFARNRILCYNIN